MYVVCVGGPAVADLHVVVLETHCGFPTYMLVFNCVAFAGPFFRMANGSNVANDSPPPPLLLMIVW